MNLLNDLGTIKPRISRAITAENPTGVKGGGARATKGTGAKASRDLGQGWKVSPSIMLAPESSTTIAEIDGPATINHLWMTCFPDFWRQLIIEVFWENTEQPAISVPYGDFFCNGWTKRTNINSIPVAVNPAGGMNCYWQMPFKKHAKIVIKNLSGESFPLYYQIDYSLGPVPEACAYLYAYWHRSNPLKFKNVHQVLPKIEGTGHYVGTYMAYQSNNTGWWGEGEMKFYLDGDRDFPTICGTGTEDYFGGAWNFEQPQGSYQTYSTAFLGLPQVIQPDGLYQSQQRFGMYRWHILDPIYFTEDIQATVQALGWREGGRYLPLQDDISSTAFFYLAEPSVSSLDRKMTKDKLEVV